MGNFSVETIELLKRIESLENRLSESLDGIDSTVKNNSESLAVTKLMNGSIAVAICGTLILGSLAWRSVSDFADILATKIPFLESREERQDDFKIDETRLKNGDTVAGFRVSSQYLDPSRDNHRGVDIAAPSGTKYYSPGNINVFCFTDDGGGGNVAEFTFAGLTWQLLHLLENSCKAGEKTTGEIIGLVGTTGRSTGPHLHLQLRRPDRSFVEPTRGHVLAVMTDVSRLEKETDRPTDRPTGNDKLDAIATATASRYGIPKNVIVAIAKHETGNYAKVIGEGNFWGLKCVGNHPSCVSVGTTEYVNGSKGSYRLKFESCESVSRCSQILGNTLRNLNESGQWDDIGTALDSVGKRYATDPKWSAKVKQYL